MNFPETSVKVHQDGDKFYWDLKINGRQVWGDVADSHRKAYEAAAEYLRDYARVLAAMAGPS